MAFATSPKFDNSMPSEPETLLQLVKYITTHDTLESIRHIERRYDEDVVGLFDIFRAVYLSGKAEEICPSRPFKYWVNFQLKEMTRFIEEAGKYAPSKVLVGPLRLDEKLCLWLADNSGQTTLVDTGECASEIPIAAFMRPDYPGSEALLNYNRTRSVDAGFDVKVMGAGGGSRKSYTFSERISKDLSDSTAQTFWVLMQEYKYKWRRYVDTLGEEQIVIDAFEPISSLRWQVAKLPERIPSMAYIEQKILEKASGYATWDCRASGSGGGWEVSAIKGSEAQFGVNLSLGKIQDNSLVSIQATVMTTNMEELSVSVKLADGAKYGCYPVNEGSHVLCWILEQ